MKYPSYTKIKDESIKNNGDLIIPEGTIVQWEASLQNTKNIIFVFSESQYTDKAQKIHLLIKSNFSAVPLIKLSPKTNHQLSDSLSYYIKVIPDAYPAIKLSSKF